MSTIAECADFVDLSERHLQTLIAEGVVKRATRGNYDLKTVTQAYIRHLRKLKQGIEGGGPSTLSDARARKELAYAEIAERENNTAKGQWVLVSDVGKVYAGQVSIVREILLTMIGQIGAALGREAEDIAERATYDALNEMADPYSDKQHAVQRDAGPIFGHEFSEKEWDENKKEYEAQKAAEKLASEKRRRSLNLPAAALYENAVKPVSNKAAICACSSEMEETCQRTWCPRKMKGANHV